MAAVITAAVVVAVPGNAVAAPGCEWQAMRLPAQPGLTSTNEDAPDGDAPDGDAPDEDGGTETVGRTETGPACRPPGTGAAERWLNAGGRPHTDAGPCGMGHTSAAEEVTGQYARGNASTEVGFDAVPDRW